MTRLNNNTIGVRRGDARGTTQLGWLDSRHSFSFGHYGDPDRMGFGPLRVLNDDTVAPGGGFGEHGHSQMKIITWVLDGALAHADSTGTRGTIQPGDVQVMSAGAGIRHSEMNGSAERPVRFLQVWIDPAERDTPPAYAQQRFDAAGRTGRWQTLVSPDGRDGSLAIRQDATLRIAELDAAGSVALTVAAGRRAYLHVATGSVTVDGRALTAGDAATIDQPGTVAIRGDRAGQVLWFDLA